MTDSNFFQQTFGFEPNEHELRLFNGRDPIDESLAYDPAKYRGTSLEQYHHAWRLRGAQGRNGVPTYGISPTSVRNWSEPQRFGTESQPTSGPGSELKVLLLLLGITEKTGCDCNAKSAQMDAWGVAGCRVHRDEIVAWMRDGAKRWGWAARLKAGAHAVTSGLASQINWLDPFPDLVDLAIERADRISNLKSQIPKPTKLILRCPLSPGDVLTLTAAIESLHTTYSGEYLTDVRSPCPDLFLRNPHVTAIADGDPDARVIDMHYPSINRSNQSLTLFLAGYTSYLGEQLGRPLTLTTNRPHLWLSRAEETLDLASWQLAATKPIWLVNAGVKSDFTAKQWPVESYQAVVDQTRDRIQWVQIGDLNHDHVPLAGVTDLRGKTTLRELMCLTYRAAGGLGPVTLLQHLCAAFEVPYVCLLGGREPVPWVTYPRQTTLHTIGSKSLSCCRNGACWKSRVVPLGDRHDASLCEFPVTTGVRPVGWCMSLITPAEVVAAVLRLM